MKLHKHLLRTAVVLIVIGILIGGFKVYDSLNKTVDIKHSISSVAGKELYLTAHRGLSGIAPENTDAALIEAGKAGYYAAEFDIMPTKDGIWVLMHDSSIDRTTDGEGEISEYTYEELLQFRIDNGNGIENYPDLQIIALEEALDICEKYSMRPMIEIKGGESEDMAAVLEIVENKKLEIEPLIIDFNAERLEALRTLSKSTELWYLVNTIDDAGIEFAKENDTALAFSFSKLRNLTRLDDAKEAGIMLASWTVDYLPFIDILAAFDVQYITTNRVLP